MHQPMRFYERSRLHMRGARSFMQGRFETVAREAFDDGWTPEEKPRPRAEDPGHHRARALDHLAQRLARRRLRPLDQSLPRLRARLHLLLRPAEPRLPRALAGPRFRDQAFRQDQRRRAAARGARKPGYAAEPDRARRQHRLLPADRAQVQDHAPDPRGAGRVRAPGHHGDQVGAGGARPRPARRRWRQKNLVKVFVSIGTLDRELARKLEPRAASPQRRLDVLKALSEARGARAA